MATILHFLPTGSYKKVEHCKRNQVLTAAVQETDYFSSFVFCCVMFLYDDYYPCLCCYHNSTWCLLAFIRCMGNRQGTSNWTFHLIYEHRLFLSLCPYWDILFSSIPGQWYENNLPLYLEATKHSRLHICGLKSPLHLRGNYICGLKSSLYSWGNCSVFTVI